MIKSDYTFRPVTTADFPLLRQWLATPHVREWWGDPDHELAMIADDLADTRLGTLIVTYGQTDFAYVQHYEVHAFEQEHYGHLPFGTRSIDTFIGRGDMAAAGHGSAYIRQLALQLLDTDASHVVIDPKPENMRAVRAYRKAGFSRLETVEIKSGSVTVMHFVRKAD